MCINPLTAMGDFRQHITENVTYLGVKELPYSLISWVKCSCERLSFFNYGEECLLIGGCRLNPLLLPWFVHTLHVAPWFLMSAIQGLVGVRYRLVPPPWYLIFVRISSVIQNIFIQVGSLTIPFLPDLPDAPNSLTPDLCPPCSFPIFSTLAPLFMISTIQGFVGGTL